MEHHYGKIKMILCAPNSRIPFAKSTSRYRKYKSKNDKAYLDWYYCEPESEEYPTRNVTRLRKLEPNYETKTFNACKSCNQHILNSALKKGIRYIIFFTKFPLKHNKNSKNDYYITGYYEIGYVKEVIHEKHGGNSKGKAIKAKKACFVSKDNAIRLQKIIRKQIYNARHVPKYLSEKQTAKVINKLKSKTNVIAQYGNKTKVIR